MKDLFLNGFIICITNVLKSSYNKTLCIDRHSLITETHVVPLNVTVNYVFVLRKKKKSFEW